MVRSPVFSGPWAWTCRPHRASTDGQSQSTCVCLSLLCGFSLKQSLSACPQLCRALDWLVGGRLRGLLFWLMTEISRGFCSQQLTYISLKQRAIATFHPVILMSNPSGGIRITQVNWCFRTFLFSSSSLSSPVPEMEGLPLSVTASAVFWCL